MKTTLDIPDAIFRKAKSAAAEKGITFREFVSSAVAEKLRQEAGSDKPWMKSFGKLRHLSKETARINEVIEQEFGKIDPAEWK
jgi:hypothetical protein